MTGRQVQEKRRLQQQRRGKKMAFEREDDDGQVGLVVEFGSLSSSLTTCQCRICHEEDDVGGTTMETPCACSGTLKFAHRVCIQRWCDEKGSTLCEICLQNFEPGYIVTPRKALIDVGVTIRGSLEVPRLDYEPRNPSDDEFSADFEQCSPASRRKASCFRYIVIACTVLLLFRHLISVATLRAENYAFTLLIVCILRASGIILPCYLIMMMISAAMRRIHQHHRHHNLQLLHHEADNSLDLDSGDSTRLQHYTIQIHS